MRVVGLIIAFIICIAFTLVVMFAPGVLAALGYLGPIAVILIEGALTLYMWLNPGWYQRVLYGIFNRCTRFFGSDYAIVG